MAIKVKKLLAAMMTRLIPKTNYEGAVATAADVDDGGGFDGCGGSVVIMMLKLMLMMMMMMMMMMMKVIMTIFLE